MTLTDYAKRRGVSIMAVSRAAKRGRLRDCVERNESGRVTGITDPELADKEWDANSDYTDAPQRLEAQVNADGAPATTLAEAALAGKFWQAKLAELKFREAAAELVPAKDVETKLVNVFAQCRTKLLGIPSRMRQRDPSLSATQFTLFESLIREALEDLATEASA